MLQLQNRDNDQWRGVYRDASGWLRASRIPRTGAEKILQARLPPTNLRANLSDCPRTGVRKTDWYIYGDDLGVPKLLK